MSRERKIEHGNTLKAERAVINGGVAAHFHDDLVGIELPLGTRQLASGDGSVVDEVVVGPVFSTTPPVKAKGFSVVRTIRLPRNCMPVVPATCWKRPDSVRMLYVA